MDLTSEIERLLNSLNELLKGTGWERRDTYYFEYLPNSSGNFKNLPDSCFSVDTVILSYGGKKEIWLKIGSRSFTFNGMQSLFSKIKTFKDEDYRGQNYFVNPDYPNGAWENHIL